MQWNILDAIPDRATLIIETNAGTRQVELETPDLDPSLKVELQSGEELPERQSNLTFDQTSAGQSSGQTFIITSTGLVPLSIAEVCF